MGGPKRIVANNQSDNSKVCDYQASVFQFSKMPLHDEVK